jgi:hypothetical protein
MSMTDSTNSWVSLEVMKQWESARFGLLGGVVGCAKSKDV